MTVTIGRRELLAALGGAAATWPLAARAQETAMPVVGFLHSGDPDTYARAMNAFHRGLNEGGFVEGRNVLFDYRWTGTDLGLFPALAADLVRRRVNVIAGLSSTAAALAVKTATTTISSVFCLGGDPVKNGLVASMERPGGNLTGVTFLSNELAPKRLGLLRDLVPNAAVVGFLINPTNPPILPTFSRRRVRSGSRFTYSMRAASGSWHPCFRPLPASALTRLWSGQISISCFGAVS